MSAHAYRGSSGWGGPILTIDSNGWVYEGTPVFGKPIMKISGEQIYRGSTSWGAPIATVKGEYVYTVVMGCANCDGEGRVRLQGHRVLVSANRFGGWRVRLQGNHEDGWPDCEHQRRR